MLEGAVLAPIDIAIIAAYFVGVLGLGLWMSRGETDSESFVVGNRQVPWLAVLCSIIATEISAATFVGVPAEGFGGNLNYLQFGIGSVLARFAVAFLFLNVFYAFGVMTVYEYLGHRFGKRSRYAATTFFLFGRVLASGVRLYIATFALAAVFAVPMWLSLALFSVAAVIYTWAGGIRSIIWTDIIQAFVFIGGGVAVVIFLQWEVGWGTIFETASAAGKLELVRSSPTDSTSIWGWFNDPMLIYVALISGFLGTTAALGTDQDLTQRMLTCRNVGQAQRSVILSGVIGIPVAALFLLVGIGLHTYYLSVPVEGLPWLETGDNRLVFPHFIGHVLPHGLRGFLIAGIFATAMSSIDSALGALSSSAVVDLYRPVFQPNRSEAHYLKACRWGVLFFAALLTMVAWQLRDEPDMLYLGLKLAAIPAGSLLGVFLTGLLTKRGSDWGNLLAMISAAIYSSVLLWLIEKGLHPLAWSWIMLLGTAWTFCVAILFKGTAGMHNRAPEPS